MQRIAGEVALDRRRVFHEARAVEGADRVRVRDARRDDLPAARVAGHEMRLDEPGGDADVRFDEAPVELHRRAPPRRDAEIDVRRIVPREVVLDAHGVEHPRIAHHLGQLRALVRTMEAGRDQHGDRVARHAAGDEALDQRSQEQVVGNRPRDVADQDAGALGAPLALRAFPPRGNHSRLGRPARSCRAPGRRTARHRSAAPARRAPRRADPAAWPSAACRSPSGARPAAAAAPSPTCRRECSPSPRTASFIVPPLGSWRRLDAV